MNEIKNYSWDEMAQAVDQAEAMIRRAEAYKDKMARFLCGRLRGINGSLLIRLKRELKDFNAQTGEWK